MKAGLDEKVAGEVAETVLRRGDDAARYKQIARRIDGLDDLPAAKQVEVIEELGARSDGLTLADELDAGALDAATQTGTLDEAADIVRATDDGARLLNDLNLAQTRRLLDSDDPVRLVSGLEAENLRRILREDAVRLADEFDIGTLQTLFRLGRFDQGADIVRGSGSVRTTELLDELASAGKLEEFLTFTVRKPGDVPADLENGVRVRLAEAFANGRLSADATAGIVDAVRTLDSDSRVSGLAKVLADDVYETSNWFNVRGALYEIHSTANHVLALVGPGDEVRMGYKPRQAENIDFESLNQGQITDISNKLGISEGRVKDLLRIGTDARPDPEFDSVRFVETSDGIVYYEAKSGRITRRNLERKMVFLLGYAEVTGRGESSFRVVSRLPASSTPVRDEAIALIDETDIAEFQRVEWNHAPD